jgi:light-regulated signal transduction histidine kinase (bacteriophytochrome)
MEALPPNPRDLSLSRQDSWIERRAELAISESRPLSRRSGCVSAEPYPPLGSVQSTRDARLEKTVAVYTKSLTHPSKHIKKTVQGMAVLITDLLSYAQASGSTPDSPALVDTETVLQMAVANLRPYLVETKAIVTWASLPRVHAHPTQLLQLLQNLIGNAIQYRNGLPPQVHVSAVKREECWVFAVRDNGIGIRAQDCDRIFEPFTRLHGNERPGTGLGLSVCKKIVEQRGGRIWVTSEVRQGINVLLRPCGIETLLASCRNRKILKDSIIRKGFYGHVLQPFRRSHHNHKRNFAVKVTGRSPGCQGRFQQSFPNGKFDTDSPADSSW